MTKIKLSIFSLFILMFLGCEDRVEHGASKIHWDRDMCDRCIMVISDRKSAVQFKINTTNKLHKFDDIGCMAIWLKDENIELDDKTEIWITDAEDGAWIDARKAFYTTENITPMAFGFSAYKTKDSIENVIDYKEVLKRVTK